MDIFSKIDENIKIWRFTNTIISFAKYNNVMIKNKIKYMTKSEKKIYKKKIKTSLKNKR